MMRAPCTASRFGKRRSTLHTKRSASLTLGCVGCRGPAAMLIYETKPLILIKVLLAWLLWCKHCCPPLCRSSHAPLPCRVYTLYGQHSKNTQGQNPKQIIHRDLCLWKCHLLDVSHFCEGSCPLQLHKTFTPDTQERETWTSAFKQSVLVCGLNNISHCHKSLMINASHTRD